MGRIRLDMNCFRPLEKKIPEELIHLSELNKAIVLKANSQRTQAIKLVDMPESLRSFESDLRKKLYGSNITWAVKRNTSGFVVE